jgi:hypothetical protein
MPAMVRAGSLVRVGVRDVCVERFDTECTGSFISEV